MALKFSDIISGMDLNKPVFVKSEKELEKLNKRQCKPVFVNAFSRQVKELFLVENPKFSAMDKKEVYESKEFKNFKKKKESQFLHIYFPWNNHLVKCVREKDYFKLKTNRNKDLITEGEQEKLAEFTVGVVGLSVGANTATALIHNGFSKNIKLADFDELDTTNLNRIRATVSDIGLPKASILERQILEINPFTKISSFNKGLDKKNLKSFFTNPKPKLIFELIDDFEMKIMLRQEAKKQKVPVVMLTSLGDSVLIDVERYDTEPKTKLFNGKVNEKVLDKILAGSLSEKEKHQLAMDIVGIENLPKKVVDSIKKIGATLVGRPQLMSTVTVASGVALLLTRKIALEEKLKSGRSLIKLDEILR